jgi:diacylglycerol kinase (ATP)
VGVITAGAVLGLQPWQWCAVMFCIALVFVAETINTAIEQLAQAVDPAFNVRVRDALDISSAAVLLAAGAAVAVGAVVFLVRLA